ncbi:MAG: MGH1-like glycoside hydrolase domain-containing protein, partial [Bacteroidota bacterium]
DLILDWKDMSARIQTAIHGENIYILYTPIKLPDYPPLLILEAGMLWNKEGKITKNSSFLQADLGTKSFGIGASRKDSLIPLPLKTHYLAFVSDTVTAFYTGKKKTLPYIQRFIKTREQELEQENLRYEDKATVYTIMQNLLGWNLIYDPLHHQAITPMNRIYSEVGRERITGTHLTAIMYALDNKYHAFSNAIAILNKSAPGSFMANLGQTTGNHKSFDLSHTPLGSIMVKMIYDKYPEKWFLEEVYDNLLSWNRWWPEERDSMGYLIKSPDPLEKYPFSKVKKKTNQTAKFESGLDTSPLFDSTKLKSNNNMSELASVGLMGVYIADCLALAEIADILDKTDDAIELRERAEKYSTSLTRLWDEESGIYKDLNLATGEFSTRLAPSNFYPLLAGVPSQEQAKRMIEEHLMNPEEFYGSYMLPSIARNDPAYDNSSCCRGRIWAPMNFLVYLGLRNYDLPEVRSILAEKSYHLLVKEWQEDRRVYKSYNAETGRGSDLKNSDDFYSWGGLLGLIVLMEEGYWDKIPGNDYP